MRHQTPADLFREVTFQFTHPGKGATTPRRCERPQRRVSIHAPWEGCDLRGSSSASLSVTFQFTHPGKGATCSRPLGTHARGGFNSRTLGRVRQSYRRQPPDGHAVSIHAPWEGCDQVAPNPCLPIRQFQFTHPGKGATRLPGDVNQSDAFQFTHPGKGATYTTHKSGIICGFQFTHPGKGATHA